MKYLILIHLNPTAFEALPEAERTEIMNAMPGFLDSLRATGELLNTAALGQPSESSVVRRVDGAPAVTDGPYAESKEFMAGYYFIDCETKERALEIASSIPDAHVNSMEVRPVIFSDYDSDNS